MSHSRVRWVIILAILLLLFPARVPKAAGTAWVRVTNTAPDSQGITVYLNNTVAVRGLLPGDTFGYFQVPAGKQEISFRKGSEIINNARVTLDLAPDDYVTVVGLNKVVSLQTLVIRDDVSPVVHGQARVRAINAIVGGTAVDILTAEGATLISNLPFGMASEYSLLGRGLYALNITPTGDPATVLSSVKDLSLVRARRYDIFIIGDAETNSIRAVVVESSTVVGSGTNQVRFGHFMPGTPVVDVYLDGEDAFLGVRFGEVTATTLVVSSGQHRVEVFAAGSPDVPVLSEFISVDNESFLVAALIIGGKPKLQTYTEDYSPVRLGRSRLQFFHLAAGKTEVGLSLTDGTPLVTPIPFGTVRSAEVGIGPLNLRVVAKEGTRLADVSERYIAATNKVIVFYDTTPLTPPGSVTDYEYAVTSVVPIRFVHAASKTRSVDVYLDGESVIDDWVFGATTAYADLVPGVHEIKLFARGADPSTAPPLLERTINIGDTPLTALAYDQSSGVGITLFPDNLQQIGLGRARVRLIQASPEVGTVRWTNAIGDTPIVNEPIGGISASIAVDLSAGGYTFKVTSTTDPNLVINIGPQRLTPGSFTTFVVTGPNDADVLRLTYQILPSRE
jgi:hypothetical protein